MNPNISPTNRGFSLAVFFCGIASITLGCCGLSIPIAALGLIFASLCKRRRTTADYYTALGTWFCIFGIIYGFAYFAYLFREMQDPAFMQRINETSRMLYGMDYTELMQRYQ